VGCSEYSVNHPEPNGSIGAPDRSPRDGHGHDHTAHQDQRVRVEIDILRDQADDVSIAEEMPMPGGVELEPNAEPAPSTTLITHGHTHAAALGLDIARNLGVEMR